MPVTEVQYRAYTKYRLKNKEKFNDYIRKNRELYPEKYLESQRKASIVYHAKKNGSDFGRIQPRTSTQGSPKSF